MDERSGSPFDVERGPADGVDEVVGVRDRSPGRVMGDVGLLEGEADVCEPVQRLERGNCLVLRGTVFSEYSTRI